MASISTQTLAPFFHELPHYSRDTQTSVKYCTGLLRPAVIVDGIERGAIQVYGIIKSSILLSDLQRCPQLYNHTCDKHDHLTL